SSVLLNANPERRDYLVLAAILVLATLLRIVGLDAPLWYDEIITLISHVRLPCSEMMSTYSMNHHYLFSLEAKAAISIWGEAAWVLRLPSLIFGVGSIAAMWVLARRVAGSMQAHVVALLLAISYHHIWFSQNARGYTELMFWSVLGTILFLAGISRPRLGVWAAFGVVLALALFTHLTGAFFFAALGLVGLARLLILAIRGQAGRADLLFPLAGFAIGAVLTLLLYAPILPDVIENARTVSQSSAVDVMQEYQNPLWTVAEAVRTLIGGAGSAALLVGAAVFTLIVIGTIGLTGRAPLLAPVTFTHILLTMLLLSAISMRIWPRFFFVDIGFLMLLIVNGVYASCAPIAAVAKRLLGGWFDQRRVFLIAAALMLVISAGLAARNYLNPKQNLAGAYAYVEAERAVGDRVLILGVVDIIYTEYFKSDWIPVAPDVDLSSQMSSTGKTWIVLGFPARTFRQYANAMPQIDSDFEIRKNFAGTLGDGNVLVYVSR
ncbi:MAG: glycosyltransferase family 39 protein, partial [Halocynthiibacter sp.]